jgi:hypothetical protein
VRANELKTAKAAMMMRFVRQNAPNRKETTFPEVVEARQGVGARRLLGRNEGRGLRDLVQKNEAEFLTNLYK